VSEDWEDWSDEVLQDLAERALVDTGVMAREVLGFNYDKDEQTGEITRPGGIYDYGPHQTMVEFLDDEEHKFKQLVTPRLSRKTTLVIARVIRRICGNLNITNLYAMQTGKEAKLRSATIKRIFQQNRLLNYLYAPDGFFDIKGAADAWTIVNRPDIALVDPTFKIGGLDIAVTGSHPDDTYLDDLVDWTNVRDPIQIQKAIDYAEMCAPLRAAGGYVIDVGTPYDEADVHHHLRDQEAYKSLWIDCGMDLVSDGKGGWDLDGDARFPHLGAEALRAQLARMSPDKFAANYCLQCISADTQLFFREQFIPAVWEDWMRYLNGYLLTDTATTDQEYGTYSVIAVVLVAADDTAYLADLQVGLWKPEEVEQRIIDTIKNWRSRCRLICQILETNAANNVFQSGIERRARASQIPLNIVKLRRGVGEQSKNQRIKGLSPRFASGKFCVLDCVPRETSIRGKVRVLWHPEGFHDKQKGMHLPSGMLVDQFVRPNAKFKDIPDALADLEAIDNQDRRICAPSPQPRFHVASRERKKPAKEGFWSGRQSGDSFWKGRNSGRKAWS